MKQFQLGMEQLLSVEVTYGAITFTLGEMSIFFILLSLAVYVLKKLF